MPAEGLIPSLSLASLLLSGPSPTTFPQTTRASALLTTLSVFQKGCVLLPPGHCSCCSSAWNALLFLILANLALASAEAAWSLGPLDGVLFLPLLGAPCASPVSPIKVHGQAAYRFVSLLMAWSGLDRWL